MRLSELKNNETAIITKVYGYGSFRKRITEMGFVKGQEVLFVRAAPFGDPIEYKILDYNISLRHSEAELIEIVTLEEAKQFKSNSYKGVIDKETLKRSAIEREKEINIALIGNPNCGKTSIFNILSDSNEHVGNYSGVTVSAKKVSFERFGYTFNLVDLPGTYSLSAYTPEEVYVRKFLIDEKPDIVINVIDASNLERNLFLTTQLIDMDIKVIVSLNMFDELFKRCKKDWKHSHHERKRAFFENIYKRNLTEDAINFERRQRFLQKHFQYDELAKLMGIPIIPTEGNKGVGLDDLLKKAVDVYEEQDPIVRHIHINYGEEIENSISKLRPVIKETKPITDLVSSRFLAIKLLEKDKTAEELISQYANYVDIKRLADKECKKIETLLGDDSETAINNAKYGFISGALKETFHIRRRRSFKSKTDKTDNILTHKILGLPIFFAFMFLCFYATFKIGEIPMGWIDAFVGAIKLKASILLPQGIFNDLIVDGIISGTGSVLVFLPNIIILFLFLSIMEDTGYMARAAFIMDKVMHWFGLHGRSFVPMVMGFGCNVPAIMATRTLRSRGDRLLTMMIIPFMSCSARLPVYVLIITAFFPTHQGLVLFGLYFLGILMALLLAQIFNRTIFKNKENPFVLELPPYRIPSFKSVFKNMLDKTKHYLKKIGGVILFGIMIIWVLSYFPRESVKTKEIDKQMTSITNTQELSKLKLQREAIRLEDSYLGQIGKGIQPALSPLGFDWKMSVCLMVGLPAKEMIVGTMGVLYQVDESEQTTLVQKIQQETYQKDGTPIFSIPVALAFLVFVLIYFPCFGTVSAIWKESQKLKWALFTLFYTTALAWVVGFLVYNIAKMFV